MQKDPVCNMEVEETEAVTFEVKQRTYFFCSEGCRDKFLAGKGHEDERTSYEVIIIGGGPAGITAAVYAARLAMDCFVIAKDIGGQAVDSYKIENYMGFDFITGPELTAKFKDQLLHSNYVDHMLTDVEQIEQVENGFRVTTSELREYHCKTLIFATGMTKRNLGVPGEEDFQRRGIFYARAQDLSLVKGKDVAVVGGGNSAVQIVEDLHTIANNIYVVSDTELTADPATVERISAYPKVQKYEGYKVEKIEGQASVSNITIRQLAGEEAYQLPVQGVFISIGLKPNSGLLCDLVECNDRGEIVIGKDCSTSCPALFAAGDVTVAYGKRIIIAAGEGAKACLAAKQYLLNQRKRGNRAK